MLNLCSNYLPLVTDIKIFLEIHFNKSKYKANKSKYKAESILDFYCTRITFLYFAFLYSLENSFFPNRSKEILLDVQIKLNEY